MTRTVARLILAMLILPCTGAVFLLLVLTLIAPAAAGPPAVGRLLLVWFLLYAFVGAYWTILWHDMVSWTPRRVASTIIATVLSLFGGVVIALVCLAVNRQVPPPIAVLLGGGTVPITWVLSTVLIWRETPAERLGRLTAHGQPALACPLCGYNLAGLTEARCPECGASFTLEQIVLAKPRPVTQPAEL